SAPAQEYPEFPLAVSEAHNLSRTEVIACLRARIQALRDEDDDVAERLRAHDAAGVPRLYWLNVDYTRAVRAAELAWLQRIVDELSSGELPWRDSPEVRAYTAPDRSGHDGDRAGHDGDRAGHDGGRPDTDDPGAEPAVDPSR